MIPEITSVLAALKTATEIAKGISTLKTEAEIRSKTSEFLNVIIDLQNGVLGLQSHVSDLQHENTSLKQHIAELESAASDSAELTFRDRLYWKQGDDVPFCPICWDNDRKQIHLSGPSRVEGVTVWDCEVCGY